MVLTKTTSKFYPSWEAQQLTKITLQMLAHPTVSIYPQAVSDDAEYGRLTFVHCSFHDHRITEGYAVYPESITAVGREQRVGVQIVSEKLDIEDLRKGTGEKRVLAGPVWLGDDGLFEEDATVSCPV